MKISKKMKHEGERTGNSLLTVGTATVHLSSDFSSPSPAEDTVRISEKSTTDSLLL